MRSWLLHNCTKVIQTPPESPDLNPIEHLWDELDRRIRTSPITSFVELKGRLVEEWNDISCNYTKKVVSCMPQRLNAILHQKAFQLSTIAPKLLYGRKECDLAEPLTPLTIHNLLYPRK